MKKAGGPAPVHYRLARSGWLVCITGAGLLALGLFLLAWFFVLQQARGLPVAIWTLITSAYAGCGLFLYGWLRNLPTSGWLIWTGKAWSLTPTHASAAEQRVPTQSAIYQRCTLTLDWQCAMLLRLEQAESLAIPRTRWVWAQSTSATPECWHALRCAVTHAAKNILSAPI